MRKRDKMSEKKIIVSNVAKEYSNPIAELVQVACQFDSEIRLESSEARINAKSIMGIMAFNPSKGMTVNIVADGSDEEEALLAMEKFLVCQ
jgi:phosphocarrier protein HPr